MINYEINQEKLPDSARLAHAWLRCLLRTIERHLRLPGTHTFSIAFVDNATMRRLNCTYRDKDRVTDILSFARVGEPGSLGELILAWPFVRAQAKKQGKTLEQELALLLIHGVLHLCGHDHETKKEAAKMLSLQGIILRQFLEKRKEKREPS